MTLRVREDGQVYTSIRLTVVAACRMYLNHFPMDVQVCNLKAESFGYDTNDVVFEWLAKNPLDLATDLQENIFTIERKQTNLKCFRTILEIRERKRDGSGTR